jgi:ABC-type branched-subunit amino acid transport system ATPase component
MGSYIADPRHSDIDRPAGGGAHPPAVECLGLRKSYGGVSALRDVSFQLARGGVLGIVGANGAGKTTLINILTGVTRPDSGMLRMQGREVRDASVALFADLGVARTFQKVRLFPGLTLNENVRVALPSPARWSLWRALRQPEPERRLDREEREHAAALLLRVGLADRDDCLATSLTSGERRLVEVARALARRPRVLLLDEPAAGLTDQEEARLARVLQGLAADGDVTLLVVEHRWKLLEQCADRILWLAEGRVRDDGPPAQILAQLQRETTRRSA